MNEKLNLELEYENIEPDFLNKLPVSALSQPFMQMNEKRFLNGLLRSIKPNNILEVGVAYGGGSSIILNAIQDCPASKLVSIDILSESQGKPIGYTAAESFPDTKQWKLITSKDAAEVLDDLNMKFDFCVLDTSHILPGEVLHFLAILPFLTDDAVVVLHDVSRNLTKDLDEGNKKDACLLLFSAIVARKKVASLNQSDLRKVLYPNIAVFQITQDTKKYTDNLFHMLRMPWHYRLEPKLEAVYLKFIKKHYGEQLYEIFKHALLINNRYIANKNQHPEIIGSVSKENFIIESNNFLSKYKDYSKRKKVIFYGASKIADLTFQLLDFCHFEKPTYLWDIRAEEIKETGGLEVDLPDWSLLENDSDLLVVLFLGQSSDVHSVQWEFLKKGVNNIIFYKDFERYLLTYVKSQDIKNLLDKTDNLQ